MPNRTIFIFECDDGRYFALSRVPHCLGHLMGRFGDLNWRLRRRLSANEMGAAYFEAALLLKSRPQCLLKLQPDGALECACGQSTTPRNNCEDPDQTTVH
jgi:hypothetical protein